MPTTSSSTSSPVGDASRIQDPVRTPFGEHSTAAEVAEGLDLGGRTAVVTGASSGIGLETARVLAHRGARVVLAVRNAAAGAQAATAIAGGDDDVAARVEVRALDLADPASVSAFARDWQGPLHVLVNNAGIMALPERTLGADGQELQMATNHLGHFALATGLHRALAGAEGARVVSLSSSGHQRCPVLFDDPTFAFVPYAPFLAYGQSKTANVLFAVGGASHWADDGVAVNAVMPGGILTGLQRHVDMEALMAARRESGVNDDFKSVEQGAATSVLLAASPLVEGVSGRYFEDCGQATVLASPADFDGRHGVAPFALDPENAERLWAMSTALVGSPA